MDTFSACMKQKYGPTQVNEDCVRRMAGAGHRRLSENWKERLNMPLTTEELQRAVNKGGENKAPGRDGIGTDFFKATWRAFKDDMLELFPRMFFERKVTEQQKRGVILCIPKTAQPTYPTDFRPTTLLNNDYKAIARILENQMRPALVELIHPSQYCGVHGKSIFDAGATVRDAITYAEVASIPLCVLSLDFKEVFEKILQAYLFNTLKSHGFSDAFIEGIKHMYANATSVVQINGHISGLIPIRSSVRQGWPLSTTLFPLCLNPLLHRLDQQHNGFRIQQRQHKTAVVAYADDVTILVTAPEDISVIRNAIQCNEATSAVLNQALAVGTWDTKLQVLDIRYADEIKVLSFSMQKTIARAGKSSWTRITNVVKIQAREAYSRDRGL